MAFNFGPTSIHSPFHTSLSSWPLSSKSTLDEKPSPNSRLTCRYQSTPRVHKGRHSPSTLHFGVSCLLSPQETSQPSLLSPVSDSQTLRVPSGKEPAYTGQRGGATPFALRDHSCRNGPRRFKPSWAHKYHHPTHDSLRPFPLLFFSHLPTNSIFSQSHNHYQALDRFFYLTYSLSSTTVFGNNIYHSQANPSHLHNLSRSHKGRCQIVSWSESSLCITASSSEQYLSHLLLSTCSAQPHISPMGFKL